MKIDILSKKGSGSMKICLEKILTGAFGIGVLMAYGADSVCEDGLTVAYDSHDVVVVQEIDLRNCWPVESLGEILLPYSAVGWDEVPLSAGAKVRLNQLNGTLVGNVFTPGVVSRDIATALDGKGTFSWIPSGIERETYRILHETTRAGQVVKDETIAAYFDFTDCEMLTVSDIRDAVLGVSQPIECVNDVRHPWVRIDGTGAGLCNVVDGAVLAFAFIGAGTFAAEVLVSAGTLVVVIDGEQVAAIAATTVWASCAWPVVGAGAHRVELRIAASGESANVGVRNVRKEVDEAVDRADGAKSHVCVDLQQGVRTPTCSKEILPFAYSCTNWIGKAGAVSASKASVGIVRLTGTDPDVTKWEEDPSMAACQLYDAPGEGTVRWKPKIRGVWRASFDIHDGNGVTNHHEDVIFDLRKTQFLGFLLFLK